MKGQIGWITTLRMAVREVSPEWLSLVIILYHSSLLALEVNDTIGTRMLLLNMFGYFSSMSLGRILFR